MAESPPFDFDAAGETVAERVGTGLARIGIALKTRAWRQAGPERLTPTQGQALVLLRGRPDGMRLDALARALGVSAPTASDAVGTLVGKGLVARGRVADDHRAVALRLTDAGELLAARVADWPDFLLRAIDSLDPREQAAFLRGLVKIVRTLQEQGDVPVQRLCVSCRYFRPHAHPDPDRPHHCAFVDAPFGERHLRLDCADQQPVSGPAALDVWARWSAPLPDAPAPA